MNLKTSFPCFTLLLLGLLAACTAPKPHPQPAFYWWKQNFNPTTQEIGQLHTLGAGTLYIKFFDLKPFAEQGIQPAASITFEQPLPIDINLIPCIYIANEVFANLDSAATDTLAKRSAAHLKHLLQNAGNPEIQELQLDCDWTNSTRSRYFQFIQNMRSNLPRVKRISATIRLHQVKYYAKTGVPPADRGLLMYYNMTNVKELNTQNSILDNREGARYLLPNKPYPLPLDLALPMFEWSVLFRNGQFRGIFNSLNQNAITNFGAFKPLKNHFFVCIKDTVFENTYLRNGDLLRLESIGQPDLQTAADICRRMVNADTFNLAFFHLNSELVNTYSHENIQDLCRRLR